MSQYLLIKKVYETKPVDQTVIVKGWVKSLRQSKKFSFLVLNDGTTQKDLQIIVDMNLSNYEEAIKLTIGSSVEVEGPGACDLNQHHYPSNPGNKNFR